MTEALEKSYAQMALTLVADANQACNECAATNPLTEGLDIVVCSPDCKVHNAGMRALQMIIQQYDEEELLDAQAH